MCGDLDIKKRKNSTKRYWPKTDEMLSIIRNSKPRQIVQENKVILLINAKFRKEYGIPAKEHDKCASVYFV